MVDSADQQFQVVVGLGNPGAQYDGTRHNIGFAVVDLLRSCAGLRDAAALGDAARRSADDALNGSLGSAGWSPRRGYLESAFAMDAGWSAALIKPQTFMNRSGQPLREFLAFRKIPVSRVVVVHDEIDLPLGTVRLKVGGGDGGHNGLRSISALCGGGYARVRVGVGKPQPGSPLALDPDGVARWVLGRFAPVERSLAAAVVAHAMFATVALAVEGLRVAQNQYHQPVRDRG
jgi:PTH1 family peptidyl-tRNA hydrolase